MSIIWNKFFNMKPMKYYQPTDYKNQKVKDILENKDNNYIATQKSDGEWCRIIKDDDKIVAQSRNISTITKEYGDKTALIPHIIEEFNDLPNGTVILGELCFNEIDSTSREVGSILRCLPAKAIARQEKHKLYFKMFDCLAYNGTDLSERNYLTRFSVLKYIQTFNYIRLCNYVEDNFSDFLQDILSKGGEGIVIHSKDYIYSAGKRPAWSTLKVKKITTELELPVLRTIEPNKSYEGKELENWCYWIGTDKNKNQVRIDHVPNLEDKKISYEWEPVTKPYWKQWKNGIIVDNNNVDVRIASGLTDSDREWLATEEAKNLIEKGQLYAVVSAMEVTPDGSLRHPRLIRLRNDI